MKESAQRERDLRQRSVGRWTKDAFGEAEATSLPQRGLRLLEEALEAYQACGGSATMAHKLVDYVFSRQIGDLDQELGGVGVTLLALAEAAKLNAHRSEGREIERILSKSLEHFAARNRAKNDAGLRENS